MPRGGARNRSGPQPDPKSTRSDLRGYKLTALPAEGFTGTEPEFPLPERKVFFTESDENGKSVRVFDAAATKQVAEREQAMWSWAWSTPQACAWSMPSESWRVPTVAMWVRTFVLCESSEATAADKGSLHRFADQIGMTPAGLKENGWQIAPDETANRREQPVEAPKRERRMRVVNGDD